MSKKKTTSKALPLIVLVVLIAIMFIAYKMVDQQNYNAPIDTGSTEDVTIIIAREPTEITRLTYTYDGEENSFDYNAATGVWSLHGESSFPLAQEPIGYMAAAISQIGVYRTLETGDTGAYGFDNPACEITVVYNDGASYRYAIGDRNNASGCLYFKEIDTGTVHMIASALLPYFQYHLDSMFVYETLPSDIDKEYMVSARVTEADLTLCETDDSTQLSFVCDAFQAFAPVKCADWHGTDEILEAYGIGSASLTLEYKRAVTITDTSGNTNTTRVATTYKLHFGTVTEDGYIPYTIGTSNIVYLADAMLYNDLVDSFTYTADSES